MTYIGIRVVRISSHIFKDEDLKKLKYLWTPSIVAGGFLYFLNLVLFLADLLGIGPSSLIFNVLQLIDLAVCLVVAFGMYRFARFIETFVEKKKEAETKVSKIVR